jgi:hypothetical protein
MKVCLKEVHELVLNKVRVHEHFQMEWSGIESGSCYNGACKAYKKTNLLFIVILRNLMYTIQ